MPNLQIDLTGQRFHNLTVIKFARMSKGGHAFYECLCDCGKTKIVRGDCLRRKTEPTKSCGCLLNGQIRHGASKTRGHKAWVHLLNRCYNPSDKSYADYGARGINVCKGWHVSDNFLQQMGQPPNGYQLDRKDNSGGYWCGECDECISNNWPPNCHWTDRKTQSRNRRSNAFIEHNGIRATVAEWSEITGIKAATISSRRLKGYSAAQCLAPV